MTYTDQDRNNDFQWFLSIYDDLYKKYGHKIFAIQNKKILGIYDDKNDAIDTTAKTYELGTFIVQECTGDETEYMCYITSWELV